jgi:hypothetical protein
VPGAGAIDAATSRQLLHRDALAAVIQEIRRRAPPATSIFRMILKELSDFGAAGVDRWQSRPGVQLNPKAGYVESVQASACAFRTPRALDWRG